MSARRKRICLGRCSGRAQSRVQCRASRSRAVGTCDDLRLAGLKLIFLAISSAMPLLSLSRRGDWWKDAEILMLRHRLAVALGERPVVPCVRPGPFGEKRPLIIRTGWVVRPPSRQPPSALVPG